MWVASATARSGSVRRTCCSDGRRQRGRSASSTASKSGAASASIDRGGERRVSRRFVVIATPFAEEDECRPGGCAGAAGRDRRSKCQKQLRSLWGPVREASRRPSVRLAAARGALGRVARQELAGELPHRELRPRRRIATRCRCFDGGQTALAVRRRRGQRSRSGGRGRGRCWSGRRRGHDLGRDGRGLGCGLGRGRGLDGGGRGSRAWGPGWAQRSEEPASA